MTCRVTKTQGDSGTGQFSILHGGGGSEAGGWREEALGGCS